MKIFVKTEVKLPTEMVLLESKTKTLGFVALFADRRMVEIFLKSWSTNPSNWEDYTVTDVKVEL